MSADNSQPGNKRSESSTHLTLDTIEREVDRQLSSHARTAASTHTQAALLISTSVIFVSLLANNDTRGCAYVIGLIFALLAILAGILAMFKKRYGVEVQIDKIEHRLLNMDAIDARREMIAAKNTVLDKDRQNLNDRYNIVALGFVCLSLSLVATVIYFLFGV